MIGDTPTTGAFEAASASRTPGTDTIGPMLTTGLDGENDDIGRRQRFQHPRRGSGLLDAHQRDLLGRQRGPQPYPPLLEVQRAPTRARLVDHDMGLHPVVGHRYQPHRHGQVVEPSAAERGRDLAERVAAEHLGTHDVRGQVTVTEAEPRRPDAVGRQLLAGVERLVRPTPALLGMDAAAEGVHHGVEVGAHVQPEQGHVVGGVPDHRDLAAWVRLGHLRQQAGEEPCGADSACQGRDAQSSHDARRY